MIQQVKVSFESRQAGGRAATVGQPPGHSDAYETLTSIIADLNSHPDDFCIVVQVTSAQSLAVNTHFNRQLDSLRSQLTKRELEILDLAINGLSNRLIAAKLFITVETVRSHRKNIVSKAGASSVEEIKTWILKTKI